MTALAPGRGRPYMPGVDGVYIGTSGFAYPWPRFYAGVPQARRLEHYAARLGALEINGSFYRLQAPETLAGWVRRTPAGFAFTLKVHRYLTHQKKLTGLSEPLARTRASAGGLGDRLRVALWQLPAGFGPRPERLEAAGRLLARAWPGVRHAFELRHPGWFTDEVAGILARHRLAVVLSDAPDFPLWDRVTTDLVYVRLHGHTRLYASRYAGHTLDRWAARVAAWRQEGREVHVYFDNDAEGHAPFDALRLADRVAARGVAARAPPPPGA